MERAYALVSGFKDALTAVRGCHNPETWDFNGGKLYYQKDIIQQTLNLIKENGIERNLSLLGGEPLCEQNIDFSLYLLKEVKKTYPNITTYCWTGYTKEELNNKYNISKILKNIDILIDGRFIQEQRDITLKWRGSPNQRILYKNIDF